MKFCWVTISVQDMKKSLDFYQNIVELTISERLNPGEGMEIVFLGDGETKVELLYNPKHPKIENPQGISLGFEVDSLDQQLKLIKEQGIGVTGGPYQPNPNTKFFFVRDPNGVSIQFVERN
ncbi:MAG: glyoxalase [Firmicutes bacterium ML8_F2]|jgi:lactoylglutathione lyase|nr:MAG: glyoxalase [Firmicutes bacterium ML8_F2]